MQDIVKGQWYDTLISKRVAVFETSEFGVEANHHYESLYLTPEGAWFLVEESEPLSPYSNIIPGGIIGLDIHPFSQDQAREWMEDHQKFKELSLYFNSSGDS